MTSRKLFLIVSSSWALGATLLRGAGPSVAEQDAQRFKVVIDYVNHVLTDASDHYRKEPSPLLANGVNVFTKEQLKWLYAGGKEAVMSDFSEQQNLMRVLAGLTNLTGDPKYKAAAKAQYAYYFAHYQSPGGLLQWGGHRFVDLQTLNVAGFSPTDVGAHEMKDVFPYYELMYETNPAATTKYLTAFWNAHVRNWQTLEISRHGAYTHAPGAHWNETFDNPPPHRAAGGLSFLDAGNDLLYSGFMLYRLTGDRGAQTWATRLAREYVKARDPKTKLGAYQFTQAIKTEEPPSDRATESGYGDRAKRQFGPDFPGHLVLEGTLLHAGAALNLYAENALMELQVGQTLGAEGKEMIEWTREGMVAYSRHALIPEKNQLRIMLIDGTDISGHVYQRDGYYGSKGRVWTPYYPPPKLMMSYARAFLITGDPALWEMARVVAKVAQLGDIGEKPGAGDRLNFATNNADAFVVFSLLDLYRQTRHENYLQLARVVGNNLVAQHYHHGYFTPFEDTIYANVNNLDPYALLALAATIQGVPDKVPYFIGGFGFFSGEYRFPDGRVARINDDALYLLRKSAPNVPFPNQ